MFIRKELMQRPINTCILNEQRAMKTPVKKFDKNILF